MSLQNITVHDVHTAATKIGGKIFADDRGYDLNIIGIRSSDNEASTFNDLLTVSYWYDGRWVFFAFPATTDPGVFYRENPINVKGTAVLPDGFHRGAFRIGKHKGKYQCLVQARDIGVWRDNDRDKAIESGVIDTGQHGIHIHRASEYRASIQVGKWSAGCQVIQDPMHYDLFMALCRKQVDVLGYKTFSYTLLKEEDL